MQKVVGGILANYEILGSGKDWLVILPGWGSSYREWEKTAAFLAGKYKILLVDLPGFGGTAIPRAGEQESGRVEVWGVYEYAEWVKELMGKVGIKEAVLLGHSFGGRIGILLASRYQRLVTRLVLVDAAGIETKTLKGQLATLAGPYLRALPQSIKNWFGSTDYRTAGDMRKTFVKVVNQDLQNEFPKINCPTLIVWGEHDSVLPISQAKILQTGIKNSILRIVWGANHWPHLQKPEEFMQILQEEGI